MTHAAMKTLSALSLAALVAAGTWTPPAEAFNFGNMMNPSRWMNRGGDRYYDDYDDGPWGYGPGGWGGPYGGGYGPGGWGVPYGGGYGPGWGAPYGAPYGGVPGYGWGAPGYGAAPAPAAVPASQPAAQPAAADRGEVEALKRRVRELEASQRQPALPPSAPPPAAAPTYAPAPAPAAAAPAREWPAAPVFRPVDKQ